MKNLASLLFLLAVIITACQPQKDIQQPGVQKGVSLQLAKDRKQNISNISYVLSFKIPEKKADSIPAQLSLTFNLSDNGNPLILDFKEKKENLIEVLKGGNPISYQHVNEHIIIDQKYLNKGENNLNFTFVAGDLSLNRNDEFLYTLLVPDRARTLFPVFDQPNLKAKYKLTLDIAENWKAVANGKAAKESISNGRKEITFEETNAISSYLFAFAAGKFEKLTDDISGMTMFYREQDQEKVARNAPEIFELHRQSMAWLEDYTGVEYPYSKFDFALIPPFQYGGMEHPGSVFYREATLFLDKEASINQRLRRASLIAHETAHMWFGNLVTMDWFNDVWLKEVFANQMASKIMHPEFPEVNHELNFLLSYYPRAMKVDRTSGTHPIQQALGNLENAGTLYGNIIYNKAPIVMRNLEGILGEEAFRNSLTEYLKTYYEDNATWDDLITIMNGYTQQDLSLWSKDWVQGKGVPVYEIANNSDKEKIDFVQKQKINGQIWPQKVFYSDASSVQQPSEVFLDRESVKASIQSGKSPIMVNVNGRGYGYFKVSQTNWETQFSAFGKSSEELTRAAFWLNSWEGVLNGDLEPLIVFEKLMQEIQQEDNSLIIAYNLGIMNTIFWQYLNEAEQSRLGILAEEQILNRILKEKNPSAKITLYRSLLNITSSKSGGEKLFEIWKTKGDLLSLNLSESDMTTLAYHIQLREVDGSENILEMQLTNLKSEDRKKRMQFVIPALSSEESVRDQFFQSLKLPENRASEPWVLEAISFLHHPIRQSTSAKFVKESLALTEEIQATGDIFFPARWLESTLGRYRSPEVAETVRVYLQQNPELSPKLKDKVLQAADMVFRTSARETDNG